MWSHFVGIRFTLSYTFLDGALQSGQRSKDLDLPTSDSSSPSASNNQFDTFDINKWHLNFVLSERIAVGSHKLDNSFKIALPRTDWVTKDPCISLGKNVFLYFQQKHHPGSRKIAFGVLNVILLISASCTASIN